MATAKEALEKMREICLALPDSREGVHFGQAAFYVKNKIFATCGDKRGGCEISFGLDADHAAALAQSDPKFTLHPRDKRGVLVDVAKIRNWSEIESLILHSFGRLVPVRVPKRKAADKSQASAKTKVVRKRTPPKPAKP